MRSIQTKLAGQRRFESQSFFPFTWPSPFSGCCAFAQHDKNGREALFSKIP
jgi:hypothetical protein